MNIVLSALGLITIVVVLLEVRRENKQAKGNHVKDKQVDKTSGDVK